MKENKYDDQIFFEKYGQMSRSQQGLAGAGEWPTLEPMLPGFAGKRVLDLGCGYGWHCLYAAAHGAALVLGVDLSEKMLAVAREKSADLPITYRCAAMEDVREPDGSFDVILSSLAFHYVADYPALVQECFRMLAPGGTLIFSCEHPVFTAEGSQSWLYGEDGAIRCFPVDNYYYEGKRDALFLGEHVTKYHRTLGTLLRALLAAGFVLADVAEPMPPQELLDQPGMKDEMRRPMMIIIKAEKP